ncbi:Site-specific recombinase XerD [Salegentibacter salegens]|uniref:Site-specific recombinase XerD n=1 Tax=Salegentibacter salegens TaxID=143223 RepID=A0A1M7HN20_9FLAO|nr:tyrosine-type recombinase/integrase [Salegentibacter salegens]SHM29733.1 Site-specific recombinase XerD [Salegentibacter salegens]
MNEQIRAFNELMSEVGNYLESTHAYSGNTVGVYRRGWQRLKEFMVSHGIHNYDQKVEEQFLYYEFEGRKGRKLSKQEQFLANGTRKLTEFQATGQIKVPNLPPKKAPLVFDGVLGGAIVRFLDYKHREERLSAIRLHCYKRCLFLFLEYCNKNKIYAIKDIDLAVLLQYINTIDCGKTLIVPILSTLRGFLKYLFEQKLLGVDYSKKIPKYRIIGQPKLPSTYSKEEIEKLIVSVDRSSAIGKRNYAIILLAARLGLRASDISRLKFVNLHWDTSTIEIEQVKTGKELILPLLPDVGNAIIDYLKYGRAKSEEPCIFLSERPPYGYFSSSNVVTHIVQRAYIKAGINTKGKRFGPHSLRHSLGFRMLEESTVLPIISEVLGHKNTESTRYYLRIDLKSMQQCMLEVPPVSLDFYSQKGGVFYD